MSEQIPYKEIAKYYREIITSIYSEIHAVTPIERGDELGSLKYPPEHLNAYGWLQKAEWRLSEVFQMEKFYNEKGFEHFGLENLHDVKSRIEHYLENTEWEYSEKVTEYHKYDEIVDWRMELIHQPGHHDYWDYFHKQEHLENYKTHVKWEIEWLQSTAEDFRETLTDEFSTTKKHLTNREELLGQIKEIETLIKKLQPLYVEIPKPKIRS